MTTSELISGIVGFVNNQVIEDPSICEALLSFDDIDGFDKIAEAAKTLTAADIRRVFKKYWQDGSKRVFEISGALE